MHNLKGGLLCLAIFQGAQESLKCPQQMNTWLGLFWQNINFAQFCTFHVFCNFIAWEKYLWVHFLHNSQPQKIIFQNAIGAFLKVFPALSPFHFQLCTVDWKSFVVCSFPHHFWVAKSGSGKIFGIWFMVMKGIKGEFFICGHHNKYVDIWKAGLTGTDGKLRVYLEK